MLAEIKITYDTDTMEVKVYKSNGITNVAFLGMLEYAKQTAQVLDARIEDKRETGPRLYTPA